MNDKKSLSSIEKALQLLNCFSEKKVSDDR